MKKVVLSLLISSVGILSQAQSQNWLEKVIVEKFYISNAADSVASANAGTGSLPVGSVTYRIFVDMLKGYKFESAYGSSTHELYFKTSTSFFNNEDRGSTTPNNNTRANDSTDYSLMVDSWLGNGLACKGYIAVPQSKDDGINTLKYSDNTIYKNADTAAGIPLTIQDGMVKAPSTYKQQSVTMLGLDNVIEMLDASNISPATGQNFSVTNGAWSPLSGAMGADTSNIVLIAQITTNGIFSYKLNIQIGDTLGNTQDFVADSANLVKPDAGEITIPSLMGSFNPPPSSSAYHTEAQILTNKKLMVYPNPATDVVNVDFVSASKSEKTSIQLYDIVGNVVMTKQLGEIGDNHTERLNVSSLAKGIYILVVTNNDVKQSYKIIKQ